MRAPLLLVVAILVAAATLLIAFVVQPEVLGEVRPVEASRSQVEAAAPSGAPARDENLASGEARNLEEAVEDARAAVEPPEGDPRTALETAPSSAGVRVHGFVWAVWGSTQPQDCSITLEERDGRRLITRLRSDATWSFRSVPAGQWTLVAEADSFRPRRMELTLRGDERPRRLDFRLESENFVPVHLELQPREAIMGGLRQGDSPLATRMLRLVSTRLAPDRVVTADVVRAGGEAGLPVFRGRNQTTGGVDQEMLALVDRSNGLAGDEFVELPADCIGIVARDIQSSFHLSLCLGSAVLRTVEIDASIGRAAFVLSVWDLEIASTTVTLRVVDAERGSALPDVDVALSDAGGAMTSATTRPDGTVRIEGLLPGWHALTMRTEGRADVEERILLVPGPLNDLGDRRLERTTTIRGFVVDEAGKPIAVRLLARPLGAVDEQRFVRALRGESSAEDGTFALHGLGRGPHVLLMTESLIAARPVRVDTSHGDVVDVRIDVVRSAPVRMQLAPELRAGTLVRLDTPEGLPVFAAVLQENREYVLRIAPGRYRLTATLEGRSLVDRAVEVEGDSTALVVQPEKR